MLRPGTQETLIRQRVNMPTAKSHAELVREVAPKIKAQAFFSARVAEGHILDRLRAVSDAYSRGEIGLGEARNTLKDFLRAEGYDDPRQAGMRNLASTGRLNLILKQNAAMANAAAEWKRMHDPDAMRVFPYVRYHARGDKRTRGEHAALDGKIFAKDDPFLSTHTPPWEFNCRCWLEEITAQEAGKTPELIQEPTPPEKVKVESESGFSFDPAHAFEEFDPGLIRDETRRAEVVRDMQQQFDAEYHDMKLWWPGAHPKKESEPVDQVSVERAMKETEKVLPNAQVRWFTRDYLLDMSKTENVLHNVDSLNRINRQLYRLKQQYGLDEIRSLSAERLSSRAVGGANPAKGELILNIGYLNGYDWSKHPHKNGRYTDCSGLLFVGHEIEGVVSHEVWHLKSKDLFGLDLPEAQVTEAMRIRRKKLEMAFERAYNDGILTSHGASDKWEFFSEIKVWEEFEKSTLPEYIKEFLTGLK